MFFQLFLSLPATFHIKKAEPKIPSKQSLVNEIRNKTFQKLKEERDLYPFGTGAGMMDQIRMLALSFHYYKNIDIEQSRSLLMEAANTFLDTINNTEQIRPFLKNYPFEPKNIQIAIFLQKSNGSKPNLGELSAISMNAGILRYDIRHPETGHLEAILKETYEEAVAKLRLLTCGSVKNDCERNASKF